LIPRIDFRTTVCECVVDEQSPDKNPLPGSSPLAATITAADPQNTQIYRRTA